MTELTDANYARYDRSAIAPFSAGSSVMQVGLDDGYAHTKVALPDGRLVVIPSRGRSGASGVTWLNDARQQIFEYDTQGAVFSVGSVDGESTQFAGYSHSALNRVIVQHALQQAGLGGHSLHVVSGLPVSAFYRDDGQRRQQAIGDKCASWQVRVDPVGSQGVDASSALPASVAFHAVIPEALAAWYDHVIVQDDDGVTLDADRLSAPIAMVDIGGRTTDYVVVQDQGVVHGSSGSLNKGLLDVTAEVATGLQARFDLDALGEQRLTQAVTSHTLRLHGVDHDVTDLVVGARRALVEQLFMATRRHLGLGAELDRVVFVGGGSAALATDIAHWFPHQVIAEHAAFANARGMLKYLQFVCDEPVTPS